MQKSHIPESELVVNKDGSIYHLRLQPNQVASTVLLVGDQGRVPRISKYFDQIDHEVQFREFVTHTGRIGKKQLSVISTGIGTDNIDIVINELDTLFNVDLKTRAVKENPVSLNLIRVGTSGTFQSDIPVGSMVLSLAGVGLDALMGFYQYQKDPAQIAFLKAFEAHLGPDFPIRPYYFKADEQLFNNLLSEKYVEGITATCAGFYGPQGRALRAEIAEPDLVDKLASFSYEGKRMTNFEMETSGIFGMASILGHKACSCNAILANRANGTFSKDPAAVVENLIQNILESVEKLP
jgi:uridine phosphorylase